MEKATQKAADGVCGLIGQRAHAGGATQLGDEVEVESSGGEDSAAAGGRANAGSRGEDVAELVGLRGGDDVGAEGLDGGAAVAAAVAKGVEASDLRAEVEACEERVVDLDGAGEGGRGGRAGDGEVRAEGAAAQGGAAGEMNADDGQQLLKLVDGEVGRSEVEIEQDSLGGELETAGDMHSDRAGVDGEVGDLAGAGIEVVGDGVVDDDRMRSGGAGWGELELGGLDLADAGEGVAVGGELGVDVGDHGDALAGLDNAGGDGVKMLELQGGVEGRVGGVLLRQRTGGSAEGECAVAGQAG